MATATATAAGAGVEVNMYCMYRMGAKIHLGDLKLESSFLFMVVNVVDDMM